MTWGLVALATLLVALLMRSPWGRVLRAIREDEDAARALGKNVFSYKMQSLVLGGVLGSVGGIMFAIAGSTVNADSFRPQITFYAYAILILGGAATRIGPIVGAHHLLVPVLRRAGRRSPDAGRRPAARLPVGCQRRRSERASS